MNRTLLAASAALLLLTACERLPSGPGYDELDLATALAPAGAEAGSARARGPISIILRGKAELGLSADQVAALEKIQSDLIARNQPLFQKIREIVPPPGAGQRPLSPGQLTVEQRAALAPLMREIHANERAAREAVRGVLTPEQLRKLRSVGAGKRPGDKPAAP
jgi:hypothetical protein